jgi:hypothetical protein
MFHRSKPSVSATLSALIVCFGSLSLQNPVSLVHPLCRLAHEIMYRLLVFWRRGIIERLDMIRMILDWVMRRTYVHGKLGDVDR